MDDGELEELDHRHFRQPRVPSARVEESPVGVDVVAAQAPDVIQGKFVVELNVEQVIE